MSQSVSSQDLERLEKEVHELNRYYTPKVKYLLEQEWKAYEALTYHHKKMEELLKEYRRNMDKLDAKMRHVV